MNDHTQAATINAEQFLLAMHYLQFLASWCVKDRSGTRPVIGGKTFHLDKRAADLVKMDLEHSIDHIQWLGQIAIRCPTRGMIENGHIVPPQASFCFKITLVVDVAVEAASPTGLIAGLNDVDKSIVRSTLRKYLYAFASNEITEKDLVDVPLPRNAVRC